MGNESITVERKNMAEADAAREAVRVYGRVLRERGVDLRNYAPANEDGAGFGWDAVQRAADGMADGTRTHMSRRMAGALREALAHTVRERLGEPENFRAAFRLMNQIDAARHG